MSVDFSEFLSDMKPNDIEIERDGFFKTLRSYFDIKGLSADWKAIEKCEDEKLITTLAMLCPFSDAEKQSLLEANCSHRSGLLDIGDCAVWVGVCSQHRDEAFKACRFIIDEIKVRLPIWKKEHYLDGDSGWVNCERCGNV